MPQTKPKIPIATIKLKLKKSPETSHGLTYTNLSGNQAKLNNLKRHCHNTY